ncbi:mannose-1-phosphate guanylyltransferase [Deltaproteobacteria bacterium]|nr:mannose-1-phosphate guanylyltransferase [Deltaproteobacteria bacterium]
MHAVIMAGGSGTRFWPYSREDRPKQFLNIGGNQPMLVETCDRLKPLARDEEMIIVLGKNHLGKATELLKDRKVHILAEPFGRNTAPCIGLGAIYARHLGCDGAIAFLPSDHFIGNPSSFLKSLEQAGKIAESGGIVTLGIIPSRPETGYGYIQRSISGSDSPEQAVFKVSAFVEKPDPEKAREYLVSGDYFWNAGIFVATHDTILEEIRRHIPILYKGLKSLEDSLSSESFEKGLKAVYEELESVSFDYGIMEKTECPVFVVPCECGWSDVGSWESLHELKVKDHDSMKNLSEGDTLLIDCKNSFVSGISGRFVACLGIDNCIIVDTDDALLVADMGRAQDIRKIVEQLKKKKKEELL